MSSHGDQGALDRVICQCLVGSQAHGISTEDSDRDVMGVYMERPEQVLGLAPSDEHLVKRDKPDGVRSQAGDTDLTLYSLREYLRLATAGNPTVLILLYSGEYEVLTPYGERLVEMRAHIPSKLAGRKFLGYLDGQRERMTGGGRQSRVPSRPELIERFGYDVKYASHAYRLALQGIQLMQTGELTLPMPSEQRASCYAMKTGWFTFPDALARIDDARAQLVTAIDQTDLPDLADHDAVSAAMVDLQLDYWRERGELR